MNLAGPLSGMIPEIESPAAGGAVDVAFVDRAHEAFRAACRQAGRSEQHFQIAGSGFSLLIAGPQLRAALTPALSHLAASPASDRLTICAWDGAATGVAPPLPPWSGDDYYGHGGIRGFEAGPVRAAFNPTLGLLSLLDVTRNLAIVWLRDARRVPTTIAGTPLHIVFQWWADRLNRVLVHAAAIGVNGKALIVAGPSGAGKSTTALTALEHGAEYLGDDVVLVDPEPEPRVHSIYSSAKIDETTLAERFPHLASTVYPQDRAPGDKHVLLLHPRTGRWTLSLPIAAVLLPVVVARAGSRTVPVGSAEIVRALIAGILPFPGKQTAAVARLARLARRVPGYRLELGRESAGVASVLESLSGR